MLIAVQNEGKWRRPCQTILGRPELASDPLFAANGPRVHNRVATDAEIAQALSALGLNALPDRRGEGDVPHATANQLAGLLDHPQVVERGSPVETATPSGLVLTLAPPFGARMGTESVPALGADTAAVRAELGVEP